MDKKDDLEFMLGAPKAAIRHMIVPFMISIITIQINVFADTFWVSGLGIDAVSGMTSAVPMYSMFSNIGIGLSVGVIATIAYRIGKGDKETASDLAGGAIVTGILLSLVFSIVIYLLMDPIVDLMGADDVRSQVKEYMLPFILLSPIVVLNTVFGGLLRAEGSAKRSTAVQMSAAVFNMILDPILIYGLGMGLMGAGLATVLASTFGLIIAAHWYIKRKTAITIGRRNLTIRPAIEKELMNVAGPRTLEGIVMSVVVLFQRVFIIMASGTPGVSLFNVPFRYVNLSMCPSEATGMAMVPVAAASYGQNDLDKMKDAMMYAMKLSLMFSLILMVVLFLLSEPLISLFTMEETMKEWEYAFVWNMRMYCIILPFFTIQTIGSSMLQAMKRSKRPMEVTMILGVVRLALFWLASSYGYQAITYVLIFSYILSAILMMTLARYEFKKICTASSQECTS